VEFDIEFSDVELPLKGFPGNSSGLIVSLDFSTQVNPIKNLEFINLFDLQIVNSTLVNSNPKFKLIDQNQYSISSATPLETIYFVVPKPQESYFSTFIAFFIIAFILGLVGALKLLTGKTQSIVGLIGGILFSIYFAYLFITQVIPDNFTRDIDMISLVGGGAGLCVGVILNAGYNLIVIRTIEQQQTG
jgi:hypothetical protein